MKKCIVISDSFKGSLPSRDICAIARERIPLFFPACEVRALSVADGGEGSVEAFLTAMGGRLGAVLVAALELFSLTPLLTADAFGFLLAAAAAGWGGLSVLCQTLAVLEGSGLRLRNCFLGKVVQSAFSLLLAALLVGYVLG